MSYKELDLEDLYLQMQDDLYDGIKEEIPVQVHEALSRGKTPQEILDAVLDRRKFLEECTPGYYNGEGQVSELAASFSSYGKGSVAFFNILEEWRSDGELKGLNLT